MPVYRGELFELTYAPELARTDDPRNAALAVTYLTNVLGIVGAATLPDPVYEWAPTWAFATNTYRNWYKMYKGRTAYSGNIPDIWLLDGRCLRLAIGTCDSIGTADGASTTLNDASVLAGDLTFTVTSAVGIADGEYLSIGNSANRNRELRQVDGAPAGNVVTVDYPLSYAHADGEAVNEQTIIAGSPAYWTHVIYDALELSPVTLSVYFLKDDLSVGLERRYYGGKIGRASISASEGEQLTIGFDDIAFRDLDFQSPDANASTVDKYAVLARPTFTLPSTERYLFSQGALSFFGTEFARIKRFTIDINNSLTPLYYVSDNNLSQIPYEIREGKKEYSIGCTVDVEDDRFFMNLVNQGVPVGTAYSDATRQGFVFSLTFTRGTNDSITIRFPSYAPVPWGTTPEREGCFLRRAPYNIMSEASIVSCDLDIIAKDCMITISDPNYYLYP